MENVSQSVLFPITGIIRSELDEKLREIVARARNSRRLLEALKEAEANPPSAETPERDAEMAQRLAAEIVRVSGELETAMSEIVISDKIAKELPFFGASHISDHVAVFMKLGTVLFDLYLRMTPEPTSPLGKLVWKKRNMELADILDKEELTVPEWAKPVMQKALLDETIWNNTSLSVWVEVPTDGEIQKRYFSINAKGTVFFKKVLDAAAEALYTEDLVK